MTKMLIITVVAVIVWVLRGLYEAQKRRVGSEEHLKTLENAKRAIEKLRGFNRDQWIGINFSSLSCGEHNSLVRLMKSFRPEREFARISSSVTEAERLFEEYRFRCNWFNIMLKINEADYSEDYFNGLLLKRSAYLEESGRTLADLGIKSNDGEILLAEFRQRHAKRLRDRLMGEIVELKQGVDTLKKDPLLAGLDANCIRVDLEMIEIHLEKTAHEKSA